MVEPLQPLQCPVYGKPHVSRPPRLGIVKFYLYSNSPVDNPDALPRESKYDNDGQLGRAGGKPRGVVGGPAGWVVGVMDGMVVAG